MDLMVSCISFVLVKILTHHNLVLSTLRLEVEKHCGLDGELHNKFCFVDIITHHSQVCEF